jgi:glycosyltransferase involved in cell wall biosynthesis
MAIRSPGILVGEKWGVMKILLFADWYEPGYKAGGPIRSCVNFARNMREDYQVFVFTSDRDLGSADAYPAIRTDAWIELQEGLSVYYCSPEMLSWQNIHRQMDIILPDFMYFNSMFSLKFTIYPLLIGRLHKRDQVTILSPRGMLRESAIRFKTRKKKLFLNGLRISGLHRGIRFHATDQTETEDIYKYFGGSSAVTMVPNFPGAIADDLPIPIKIAGDLSMIFVGRIHPIKNLDFLLEVLKEVSPRVRLTIVGSMEDEDYWEKCKRIISALPDTVKVEYAGEMANRELQTVAAKHHIFALPTSGENFGHAIFEALALGRPVLISDQTPWRGLQAAGAGWDLPLNEPGFFRAAIGQAGAWGQEDYKKWCGSTREYIKNYIAGLNLKDEYQKLFS